MRRIAITGANGTIGTVLKKGLTGYKITSLDLPKVDVRDYEKLLKILPDHDAVIHLAWETKTDNFRSGKINPDNVLMTYNVYQASVESKVPRIIMASSIHADSPNNWRGKLLTPDRIPIPDSPYGASKVFMESLGRYYAQKYGLEVVCIRFGGVNKANKPSLEEPERSRWLSHKDCTGLVRGCIYVRTIPHKFLIIYGVSNNPNRIYDYTNPLGWIPHDSAEDTKF